jgi:hypothetical protein
LPTSKATPAKDPAEPNRWADADDVSLESRARALSEDGKTAEAVTLLSNEGRLFAGHVAGEGGLPCLCRQCLLPAVVSANSGGISFFRDFVVARRRVLFYWAPSDLGSKAEQLRYSMRTSLRVRLNELRLQRWHKRAHPIRINPFTGQPIP